METQRPWPERALSRTTPVLWRRDAIMTLTAHLLIHNGAHGARSTAWHPKTRPTCADALAVVRRHVWDQSDVSMSPQDIDRRKIPHPWLERFTEARGYAAYMDKVELRGCQNDGRGTTQGTH
jgi:hypothetical protein